MDSNRTIAEIFSAPRALIGMIHVGALPGSPKSARSIDALIETAVTEARTLKAAGFNGLGIENMHDRPYLKGAVGPEVTAAMTAVACAVRQETDLPIGIQVLSGANREALAVALAAGAAFIRVEGFVFAHVGDEGMHDASAGELLRYRRALGAEHVRVFADIKKKHSSHAITADVDLAETARAAEFFLADGVIVTGTATGRPTAAGDVVAVSAAVGIPTLVGSGVTPENLAALNAADAFIIGSSLKVDGLWSNPLDAKRVEAIAGAFERVATVR